MNDIEKERNIQEDPDRELVGLRGRSSERLSSIPTDGNHVQYLAYETSRIKAEQFKKKDLAYLYIYESVNNIHQEFFKFRAHCVLIYFWETVTLTETQA